MYLNLKRLPKVWIGQNYFFYNGSLNVVKRLLMNGIPPTRLFLGLIPFGSFVLPHSPTGYVSFAGACKGSGSTSVCGRWVQWGKWWDANHILKGESVTQDVGNGGDAHMQLDAEL
jgi:hypothetical protein